MSIKQDLELKNLQDRVLVLETAVALLTQRAKEPTNAKDGRKTTTRAN